MNAPLGSSRLTRFACPRRTKVIVFVVAGLVLATSLGACQASGRGDELATTIRSDPRFAVVITKAESVVHDSVVAGDHYPQVWIRDLNTFLQFDLQTGDVAAPVRAALIRFTALQEADGAVPDGYVGPSVFKNTTESDQESSLVQAVAEYVATTDDRSVLTTRVKGQSVLEHLTLALDYLWINKITPKYGLVWSGVTVDWGDVQAYSTDPTNLAPDSARAVSVYANAMFSLAIRDFLELPGLPKSTAVIWKERRAVLDRSIRYWLWDPSAQKYRAHLYLRSSPFPANFNESQVFYEGGTSVAIQAGLLGRRQILLSLARMEADMQAAHADSIGITAYPPYPASAFPCCRSGGFAMTAYSYQNGGDWDWFGARMVQDLIGAGMYAQAYRVIQPMLARVVKARNFYEWWTPAGEPDGSPSYHGAAGELGLAALQLYAWAKSHNP
jgi:hypothetical protein